MTAAEIRAHSSKTYDDVKRGLENGDVQGALVSALMHIFQMQAETAAQLDELVGEYKLGNTRNGIFHRRANWGKHYEG
jgi:hypothetical protein